MHKGAAKYCEHQKALDIIVIYRMMHHLIDHLLLFINEYVWRTAFDNPS